MPATDTDLGKKGKRERNVHCRDDKSGINRATSRLSININSETRIPRGQIRELDSHSIPMRRWASRKSSNIRSNLLQRTIYDVDRSCTRPLTTSTIFLLAATSSFLSTRRYARLLSRRPSSNAQRDRLSACSAFFLFFSPFLSFSKGILDSTGERDHRDNVRFGEVRVSIIAIPFKKLRIVFKYTIT